MDLYEIQILDLVVCFSESQINVTEDQGSAVIVLTLTAPSSFDISVTVFSTNGTAIGQLKYNYYCSFQVLSILNLFV